MLRKRIDSLGTSITLKSFQNFYSKIDSIRLDSVAKNRIKGIIATDTAILSKTIKKQLAQFSKPPLPGFQKPFLKFNGGYISYDWNYRSNIDTPFLEKGISQHLVSSRLYFTLGQALPLILTYVERETNSMYFKNYRDVRVEFNTSEFRRLKTSKLSNYLNNLTNQIHTAELKPSLDFSQHQLKQLDDWLHQGSTINQLIQSRIKLINSVSLDSNKLSKDSILQIAKSFIAFYDEAQRTYEKLSSWRDSLERKYVVEEKQVQNVRKLLNGNPLDDSQKNVIKEFLKARGMEQGQLVKFFGLLSSVRTVALGKVIPNYSDLTVKNINLNGVNLEYYNKIYLAFTAGAIDFRARDFYNTNQPKSPQFVYAGRIGYGAPQGSHLYFTAYKGKKQLLSINTNPLGFDVYGMAVESQVQLDRNNRFKAELAQSVSPNLVGSNGTASKSSFDLKDQNNKAYSLQFTSYLSLTRTKMDAYYGYRGINFQSFSSYYTNSTQTNWHVNLDQYVWNGKLRFVAALSQNNFDNPYLPSQYNGHTVFKNMTASFRARNWPTLSLGYMPSSQLSQINGQVFQNFYQTLTGSISDQYNLGAAHGFTTISYNKLYNDSRDSGFLYYNAQNIFLGQSFQFLSYTANITISRSSNPQYVLTVLEAGISAKIFQGSSLGFGFKINQLNDQSVKVGLYGREQITLKKLGEINAWIEKTYLPGAHGDLVKTELYNIGFTRYLK